MSAGSHENRLAVVALATEYKARTIVEVGVRRGRLSKLLNRVPTLEYLFLIDIWLPESNTEPHEKPKNLRYVKRWADTRDHVIVYHMPSKRAADLFGDCSVDFVYIDGDHSVRGATTDINSYLPKVRVGGIICGDDHCLPGVHEAVDRLIPHREVHQNGRLWWAVKSAN